MHNPRPQIRRNTSLECICIWGWYAFFGHVNNRGTINRNYLPQSEHHWANCQRLYKSIRRFIRPTKMQLAMLHPINNNKIRDEYPSLFPLRLTSTATTQISMIHQMQEHQPHHQLGVHLVPSLSPKCQIQLLTNWTKELKVTLRWNSITAHQAATIFEHYIALSISYPCTTHSMSTSDIDKLQIITLNPILAKLSMTSTSTRNMIYLPANFGGAGLKRWSMEILAQQIALLSNQVDSQEWIGFILQASMNTSLLEFSWAMHFLERQHKIITYTIAPTWITSIQSNAVAK